MTLLIQLFVLGLASISAPSLAAPQSTPPSPPTLEMLRARAQERMRQDLTIYSREDLRALEELYQTANRDLRGPQAKDILQRVVKDYPKSNRAGSAILYLAQMSSGAEREAYLKTAIEAHGDAWYGDGVQVGAFARAQLANVYVAAGKLTEAKALADEIVERFPGAVDHRGQPLLDMLRALKLR
jgi:hypothetical protein